MHYLWGFPCDTVVKNLLVSAGDTEDLGLLPGSGRSPGEGNVNQLQYSCLEHSMDREAWWATVHGVAKSGTQRTQHMYYLQVNYKKKKLNTSKE